MFRLCVYLCLSPPTPPPPTFTPGDVEGISEHTRVCVFVFVCVCVGGGEKLTQMHTIPQMARKYFALMGIAPGDAIANRKKWQSLKDLHQKHTCLMLPLSPEKLSNNWHHPGHLLSEEITILVINSKVTTESQVCLIPVQKMKCKDWQTLIWLPIWNISSRYGTVTLYTTKLCFVHDNLSKQDYYFMNRYRLYYWSSEFRVLSSQISPTPWPTPRSCGRALIWWLYWTL